MRTIFFLAVTVLFNLSSFSQEDSTKKATLKFDLSYVNNSVYLGRKDSSELSYFTPGIFYTAPSGFFASANLSFLMQESRMDAATLEAGYDYAKGNFDASLSAAKFFYNNQSVNVKSTVSAGLNAYLTYETPYLTPALNGSISFGNNQPDYFAGFGLEHSFYAGNALTVTPSATANGGTQNFYDGYYKLRKGGKKKLASASVTQETLNASAFKILDYELAADLTFKANNFSFFATPVYAIATNPNVIVTTVYRPNGAVLSSQSKVENLSNSFYCTVGLSYKLGFKGSR